MEITMLALEQGPTFTVCELHINGRPECLTMQDGPTSADGHPRIAAGTYEVRLRKEGGKHEQYLKRFGQSFHKGMLEIVVPGRKYILWHLGNTPKDSLGCPLTGVKQRVGQPDFIEGSEIAYRKFYPKVLAALLNRERVRVTIKY